MSPAADRSGGTQMVRPGGLTGDLHWLLLALAGRVPDEVLYQARNMLAIGRRAAVVQAVAAAVAARSVPLTVGEAAVLTDAMAAFGGNPAPLRPLARLEQPPQPPYAFVPAPPDQWNPWRWDRGWSAPPAGDQNPAALDDLDRAAVDFLGEEPTAVGLWRTWRHSPSGGEWPAPSRVFVLEVDRGVDLPALTGRLQQVLSHLGVSNPQVEVYAEPATLAPYQRMARSGGALIWTRRPAVEIRTAKVFDDIDPSSGPLYWPDHPRITDPELRQRVVDYLRGGEPLLLGLGLVADVVAPGRGEVVPIGFHTDGQWIWTESLIYYLEQHHLAPEPALLEHIAAAGHHPPVVDAVDAHRAMAVLRRPPEDELVWPPPA